jgi:hypothetical protein
MAHAGCEFICAISRNLLSLRGRMAADAMSDLLTVCVVLSKYMDLNAVSYNYQSTKHLKTHAPPNSSSLDLRRSPVV